MTGLASLIGMQVVARDDAERIGEIEGVVVDVRSGRVLAWQVGKGRKAQLVDHQHVTGIGDTAVVDSSGSVREPAEGLESAVTKGDVVLLGARVLADDGTELGTVRDVEVDTDGGVLGTVTVSDDARVEASRLRALGSYALVVRA